jgi:hypothetical protein
MKLGQLVVDISGRFGRDRFESGDCHNLAVALYMSNAGQGTLEACIRQDVDQDGKVCAETYSHLVYVAVDGTFWDADGPNADVRWEDQWAHCDVDKWGLHSEFRWETVDPGAVSDWLQKWNCRLDHALISEIVSLSERKPFAEWFGKSKVVDEKGRPVAVYHGTNPWEKDGRQLGNVHKFDRLASVNIVGRRPSIDTVGSWFSTNPGPQGAEMYGNTIYPVYLSIQNPHETTFRLMLRRARLLANGEDDGRMVGKAEVDAYRTWLGMMGKDGIKIVHDAGSNSTEFEHQDAWIALEPEQIRFVLSEPCDFEEESFESAQVQRG